MVPPPLGEGGAKQHLRFGCRTHAIIVAAPIRHGIAAPVKTPILKVSLCAALFFGVDSG
jgi:hypothetical protein